jgi:hypothetical protein
MFDKYDRKDYPVDTCGVWPKPYQLEKRKRKSHSDKDADDGAEGDVDEGAVNNGKTAAVFGLEDTQATEAVAYINATEDDGKPTAADLDLADAQALEDVDAAEVSGEPAAEATYVVDVANAVAAVSDAPSDDAVVVAAEVLVEDGEQDNGIPVLAETQSVATPVFQLIKGRWRCSICSKDEFLHFIDACAHEATCSGMQFPPINSL